MGDRVGIYARVSTSEQSTAMQLSELNRYANARGWRNIVVYEDSGVSGTSTTRPALKRLLADCRARRIDTLMVWKLDRLFRSLRHLLNVLNELGELNISFISLKDQIDLTTSNGRLLCHLLAAFGEFERSLIVERVKCGLRNAKAKGKVLGRPKTRDDAKIRELRRKGLSIRKIAKQLGVAKSTVQDSVKLLV